MDRELEKINDKLDLNRTDELFDSSIGKSEALSRGKYDKESLKAAKTCLGFGNLHVNTAKVKIATLKIIGYRDQVTRLKQNVDRKLRNSRKY